MSLVFLKIKLKSLASESKFIRKEELKRKKWKVRTVIQDMPFGDNYKQDLVSRGWQIQKNLVCPRGRPDMTEEERQVYREQVWKYRARIRKLNPAHDPDLRHRLHEHRIKVVRPEARATHLAIAYLKGQPYKVAETPRKPAPPYMTVGEKHQFAYNPPNLDKIWRMVTRFGGITENDENKAKVENWLKT